MNKEKSVSIGTAAALLGICPTTVRRWDRAGKLTSVRTAGGHRRYRLGDIYEIAICETAAEMATDMVTRLRGSTPATALK